MAEVEQIKTVNKFIYLGYILESKFTNVSK
jgi:hypothetical protein